jgi:hypothetical protein
LNSQTEEKEEVGMKKGERDIEKSYPVKQFVQKLRRLADAIENGKRFQIQIACERISASNYDAVIPRSDLTEHIYDNRCRSLI